MSVTRGLWGLREQPASHLPQQMAIISDNEDQPTGPNRIRGSPFPSWLCMNHLYCQQPLSLSLSLTPLCSCFIFWECSFFPWLFPVFFFSNQNSKLVPVEILEERRCTHAQQTWIVLIQHRLPGDGVYWALIQYGGLIRAHPCVGLMVVCVIHNKHKRHCLCVTLSRNKWTCSY